MASSSRSSSQQSLIKESEREEAADQRFGRQLLKNEGKRERGATDRCIHQQLLKKEEAKREGGGHPLMHQWATLQKEAREMEERRLPIDALANNFLKKKRSQREEGEEATDQCFSQQL